MIPEENDDYWNTTENTNHVGGSSGSLSLPLQQNQMTGSVETNSHTYSPYGNSPAGDHVNSTGYMVMSPGIDYNKRYLFVLSFFTTLEDNDGLT